MTEREAAFADLLGGKERRAILESLNEIKTQLASLLASIPTREVITVAEIRTALGVGRDWLRVRPWMLPNFGVPDLPGRPRKWLIKSWEAWKAVGFESHESAWVSMSEAERARIMKGAAV